MDDLISRQAAIDALSETSEHYTEKAICKKYRQRDERGKVQCRECPPVISVRDCVCKANVSEDEWRKEDGRAGL